MGKIAKTVILYLNAQIAAGAQALQISTRGGDPHSRRLRGVRPPLHPPGRRRPEPEGDPP